jgi:hypothetical protein
VLQDLQPENAAKTGKPSHEEIHMRKSRSIKNILRISAWSTVLAFGLMAQAEVFYQTTSLGGSDDWNGAFYTNATTTVATNPVPGSTYINDVGNSRTPTDGTSFLGDSLTLAAGRGITLKNASNPTTVNLIMENNANVGNGGGGTAKLGGTLTGSGDVSFDNSSASRTIELGSLISADNTFSSMSVTGLGILNVTNSANTFTGVWNVVSGTLMGTGLGDPSGITIGSAAVLNFDADFTFITAYLDMSAIGSVLILDQEVTVNTATIWLEDTSTLTLDAGTYTGAELKALNSTAFAGSVDGNTLTVLTTQSVETEEGITVYQTSNMVVGVDWNNPAYWDNGEAPASTNDYINNNYNPTNVNPNAWATRTPESGSGTFGGKSLTLTNNAVLNLKSNGPWTINNFDIWAGSAIQNGGAAVGTINGSMNLKGSGSVVFDTGSATRKTTIGSLLTTDSTITNIIVRIGQATITNTADQAIIAGYSFDGIGALPNTFDGLWVVESGYIKGEDFGSGSFLVTDLGILDFDYSYINPSADITVEANPTNAAQNGMLLLDQNIQVGSVTLEGVSLPEGSYTGADLKAAYGAVIHPDTSDLSILAVGAAVPLPVYQVANANPWTTASSWDNGEAPSSLYAYVNPGFQLRNPTTGDQVFPGKSLSMGSGSSLKLQNSQNVTITNFTVYAGSEFRTVGNTSLNGDLAILGEGSILWDVESIRTLTVNSEITVEPEVTTFTIRASQTELAGTAGGVVVTDPNNTFAGEWIIEEGFLKGPGVGQSSFHVWESGYLAIGAVYSNEAANLTIDSNSTNAAVFGQMLLEYDMTVGTATIGGTELAADEYTGAELKTMFGDMIAPTSSDTAILKVTFIPEVPEIGDVEVSMSGSDLLIGWVATNYVTYTVQADDNLVLEPAWYITVTNITGVDGPVSITNDTSVDPTMFYRVIGN